MLRHANSSFLSLNLTPGLGVSNEISLSAPQANELQVSFVNYLSAVPEPAALAFALPAAL